MRYLPAAGSSTSTESSVVRRATTTKCRLSTHTSDGVGRSARSAVSHRTGRRRKPRIRAAASSAPNDVPVAFVAVRRRRLSGAGTGRPSMSRRSASAVGPQSSRDACSRPRSRGRKRAPRSTKDQRVATRNGRSGLQLAAAKLIRASADAISTIVAWPRLRSFVALALL